jgi:hypothetical protein
VRVRAAHRDYWLAESRPEEWLLIEWPEGVRKIRLVDAERLIRKIEYLEQARFEDIRQAVRDILYGPRCLPREGRGRSHL